jgi:hypothetical protein
MIVLVNLFVFRSCCLRLRVWLGGGSNFRFCKEKVWGFWERVVFRYLETYPVDKDVGFEIDSLLVIIFIVPKDYMSVFFLQPEVRHLPKRIIEVGLDVG